MPDTISTDDLYGPSNPPTPEGHVAPAGSTPKIPVEETPEIVTPPRVQPKTPVKRGSFLGNFFAFIVFVGLFVVGVWLSSYLRQYLPNGLVGLTPAQQEVASAPTPIPTPTPSDPFATWKTYSLGTIGVTYKLPSEVLPPVCDTTSCLSQGTYLTGRTRFTIAPRGAGQGLIDFRGSLITDVGGKEFVSATTTVGGHRAISFTGSFAGKTVGGYGFTQMHGYMIEVTPTVSLEINHFTPTGVAADWVGDEVLFEQIVTTLVMPPASVTPTPIPIATAAATPATTSGN